MPTGYTYKIADGTITTLKEFALKCAEAFLPQFHEGLDSLERSVDHKYYIDKISTYQKELEEFKKVSTEQMKQMYEKYKEEKEEKFLKFLKQHEETCCRYELILYDVEHWIPPTAKHKGLRDFMIQQLQSSIEWESEPTPPEYISLEEYIAMQQEEIESNIEYSIRQYAEECKRVKENNAWITSLLKSLEKGLEKIK